MRLKHLSFLLSILPAIFAGSCTSTDVIEPEPPEAKSDIITLNLSAPEAFSFPATRAAHEGHQLRYVAQLYHKNELNQTVRLARKELLASAGNLISFVASEGTGEYTVTLFADYIDEGATPNENGYYPDKYYNTQEEGDYIEMLTPTIAGKKIYPVNNDNYDCFALKHTIKKTGEAYNQDLTLKRSVSKIIFQDKGSTGSRKDGVYGIKLTKLSFMNQYSFSVGYSIKSNDDDNLNIEDLHTNDNVLFYFYTFPAAIGNDKSSKSFNTISFDIIPTDNTFSYNSFSSKGSFLFPEANYVYRVKGDFFVPKNAPALPGDMINLTVSVDKKEWVDSTDDIAFEANP